MRRRGDRRERHQVALGAVRQIRHRGGADREAILREEQGVAVTRRFRRRFGGDVARRTAAVLDDDRLLPVRAQTIRHHASDDVGRASRRIADQQAHGLGRVLLRDSGQRKRENEKRDGAANLHGGSRVGDVERAALGAAEGDVGHEARLLAGVHEMGRQAVRIEAPDPHSEVAHGKPVLLVRLDAVGAGVTARELDRDAGLGERASGHERQPPDLLRARNGHEHVRVGLVERDAIGGGRIVDEALQLAARAQAIHAPARVGDARLSLVGEIEIAVVREMQIVQALEALAERSGEVSLDFPRLRVEQHQAALVVGDENPAAFVDLQPVRPAVVLHDQLPFPFRVDPEYAPKGNVHAPQVPVAIERGTFEKAVDLSSAAVGVGPSGAALLAELRWKRGERPRLDAFDFLEGVVH